MLNYPQFYTKSDFMKISEITLDTVRDYINAFEETDDNIQMLLNQKFSSFLMPNLILL